MSCERKFFSLLFIEWNRSSEGFLSEKKHRVDKTKIKTDKNPNKTPNKNSNPNKILNKNSNPNKTSIKN